jgi:hypothetical protein
MNFAHIGLPKCASSTLQSNVFSKLDSYNYIGPSQLANVSGDLWIKKRDQFTCLHDAMVDAACSNSEVKLDELKKEMRRSRILNANYVFSSEWITGIRYSPQTYIDNITRLRSLFEGDCMSVLVVRPHIELIASMFRDNPSSLLTGQTCNSFHEFYFDFIESVYNVENIFKNIYDTCEREFQSVLLLNLHEMKQPDGLSELIDAMQLENNFRMRKIENSGLSKGQFFYMKYVRKCKFLKIFIPTLTLKFLHKLLMTTLRSKAKFEVEISQTIMADAAVRFKGDWQFITKKINKDKVI